MSKKKRMAKATLKKAAPRKKKPVPKKRTAPRQPALPGTEQLRNARLDRLCESIGEGRETKNKLIVEEKADLQAALREMHDRNINAYRHAGVELYRIGGEEKLRVRLTKEDASDMTPSDAEVDEVASRGDRTGNDGEGGDDE